MPKEIFLNDPKDVDWLFDVHLKRTRFKSFVLIGNEDSPGEVLLYEDEDPDHDAPFVRVEFGF